MPLLPGGVASLSGVANGAVAMAAPSQQNVALAKPTFGDSAFSAPTSRGDDGIDGFAASGNWTHADYPASATPYPGEVGNAPNPFWEVDLQGSYHLDSFAITDRVGCCDPSRLDGFIVTLYGAGGSIVGSQTLSVAAGGGDVGSFDNGGVGFSGVERVRIDGVNEGSAIQYFQFSEFEALSTIQSPVNWALGAGPQYFNASGTAVTSWPSLPVSNLTDGNRSTLLHPNNPTPHVGFYVNVDLGQEILIDKFYELSLVPNDRRSPAFNLMNLMKIRNVVIFFVCGLVPTARAQLVEINVAQWKATFGDSAFSAPTGRGNDGIDGTTNAGNWTHADYPASAVPYPGEVEVAPNPYWEVDLGEVFDLTRIQLVDRVGCCDPNRLNGSTITLLDDLGAAIGTPITVDGLVVNNPAGTALVDFDNGGDGWAGVARIRIDGLATNQYFQFSEFRAFSLQPVPIPNAALGAIVTASGPTWPNQGSEKITDGNLNTQSHPQADVGTLGFTYSINLGKAYNLEEILIHNRVQGDCCPERLTNYRVSLHNDDGEGLPGDAVWSADLRTDGSNSGIAGIDRLTAEMDADGVFTGQYIVVENLSDGAYNPQIAELEALTYDELPVPRENFAFGATAGYFDALGAPASPWAAFPVANVTDGLTGTFIHPLDEASADYYLEIDMGVMVTAGSIEVTGRTDGCCADRLEDARLELLDAGKNVVFTRVMAGQVTTTQIFELPGTANARFVRITNVNGASYGPQVGEVGVYAPAGDRQLVVEVESVVPSSGRVSLTFNSAPGSSYAIFASSTLNEGTWAGVIDNVASQGEKTGITFTDSFGIGQAKKFYRVERE